MQGAEQEPLSMQGAGPGLSQMRGTEQNPPRTQDIEQNLPGVLLQGAEYS